MIAVMMPTGIPTGATIVRATRSHTMRNAAPNSADAGSTSRWSAPTMSRTMCGTMMPTKSTGPPSDTAAPVDSDALTSAMRSVRDDVHAARLRRLLAEADEIEHARQRREAGAREAERHERRHESARSCRRRAIPSATARCGTSR